MITVNGLIAVLFQVMAIISANNQIPQSAKDDIIAKITVAIANENSTEVSVETVKATSTVQQESAKIKVMQNAKFEELVKPESGLPYAVFHVNDASKGLIHVWSENVNESGNPRSDSKQEFTKKTDGLKWEFESNGGKDVTISKYNYEITSKNQNGGVIGTETGSFEL